MQKIIKFDNCLDCPLTSYERKKEKCPIKEQNNDDACSVFSETSIHKDCPLEDYNRCQYHRTNWMLIAQMKSIHKECWILDEDKRVGVGNIRKDGLIVYDLDRTDDNFGKPVEFAQIKPNL